MSHFIHKSHNVAVLIYHLVCPAKYRRVVFTREVDNQLRDVCLEVSKRYDIIFLEIGVDADHVHFLVQSVPTSSPSRLAQTIKSITAREIFKRVPLLKKQLWGGEFWSTGYFINTVGQHGNEDTITKYIQNQGIQKEYEVLYKQQLELF